MEPWFFVVIAITTSAIAGVLGFFLDTMRNDAIKRGFAHYNPKTGVWEWMPPANAKDETP